MSIPANDNLSAPQQIRMWLSQNPDVARRHYKDCANRLNYKLIDMMKGS